MSKSPLLKSYEKCCSDSEKLDFLLALNLPTVIKQKGEIYYAFISRLSLSCESSSVEDCYKQLQELKRTHFVRLIETDSGEDILFQSDHFFFLGELSRLKLKVMNYLVTTVFIVGLTLFLGWQISAIFARGAIVLSDVAKKEMHKINDKIKKARDVSPEKRKERIEKFRSSLLEVKPYTDAISEVIFDCSSKVQKK